MKIEGNRFYADYYQYDWEASTKGGRKELKKNLAKFRRNVDKKITKEHLADGE